MPFALRVAAFALRAHGASTAGPPAEANLRLIMLCRQTLPRAGQRRRPPRLRPGKAGRSRHGADRRRRCNSGKPGLQPSLERHRRAPGAVPVPGVLMRQPLHGSTYGCHNQGKPLSDKVHLSHRPRQRRPAQQVACGRLQGARVERLRWHEPCSLQPDIILGSDLIYDPGMPVECRSIMQLESCNLRVTTRANPADVEASGLPCRLHPRPGCAAALAVTATCRANGQRGGGQPGCARYTRGEAPCTYGSEFMSSFALEGGLALSSAVSLGQDAPSRPGVAPVAYLATAVRNEASLQLFMQAAAEAQLHVCDCSRLLEVGSMRFLHRLRSSTDAVVLHAVMQMQA